MSDHNTYGFEYYETLEDILDTINGDLARTPEQKLKWIKDAVNKALALETDEEKKEREDGERGDYLYEVSAGK